jgi:nitroimidazol reductase NimA-like FMN-containing flavoprotein (pyridoxamine 5'-phosphate oxidase superfamily)
MTEKPKRRGVRMDRDEAWDYVQKAHTGILTTLRKDGVPIAIPLWFAIVDGRIYFRTRGKKLGRIKRDERASFLVEAGKRWAELSAVHFTGRAEIVEPGEELAARIKAETDRKYADLRVQPDGTKDVSKKQDQYMKEQGAIVCFTPDERILSWDNTRLGLE